MNKRLSNTALKYFNTLSSINSLLFLTIFLLPTHFFFVWRPEWSYWNGILVDYWAPKVWISTLSVVFLWFFSLMEQVATRGKPFETPKKRLFLLWQNHRFLILGFFLWLTITFLQILNAPRPWASVSWLLNLLMGPIALGLWLNIFSSVSQKQKTLSFVIFTALFQGLIGLYQAIWQQEVAGYWFLGEPDFHPYAGLAVSELTSAWRYLPYGTTAHPNVLAGWLVAGLIGVTILRKQLKHRGILIGVAALLLSALLATESFSGILTLLVLSVVLFLTKTPALRRIIPWFIWGQFLFFLCLPLVVTTQWNSLQRRKVLLLETPTLISSHPWGMGPLQHLGSYRPETLKGLQAFSTQPIHNFWVIFTIESSIWILLLLLFILYREQINYPRLSLLFIPILSLDHYVYTLNSGWYLLLILSMFFNKET